MNDRAPLWTLIGIVVFFKVYAVVLIMVFDASRDTVHFMLVMNFPFILGGLALVAIPALVWYRLIKVRARRRRLIEEEWHVEEKELSSEVHHQS